MCLTEGKERRKASDLCLLWREEQVEAQVCFFLLSQPLLAVFLGAPGQGHVM